jgi:hypothetical protein
MDLRHAQTPANTHCGGDWRHCGGTEAELGQSSCGSLRPSLGFVTVERPRVYGDEMRCRTALKRYVERGDELLDQAVGVRKRMDAVKANRHVDSIAAYMIEQDWAKELRRWFSACRAGLGRFFQDQMEQLMPVLTLGLPPETGKPRHWIGLENGVPWLEEAIGQIRQVQDAVGVQRGVPITPTPSPFDELRASGLVAQNVINDRAKEMRDPRTPAQLAHSIAAAKELTEATLRAALDRLGSPWTKHDNMPTLVTKWRNAVMFAAAPDRRRAQALGDFQESMVLFLAQWRNAYGSGHGKPAYPRGLRPRHARMAADTAESFIRLIVTTLDDLSLLPPP